MEDHPMSIVEHLGALRRTLIISIISTIPGAVVGWYLREHILRVLIKPVSDLKYKLVYLGATEALTAEMKLAFFAGVFIASPVIAYQFWKFLLPALHASEKRYIMIFVPLSLLLFIGGVVFGYYSVFTFAVQFLLSFGGEGLTPMLSLSKYLSFTLWFLIPFGLMFEMPLVILLLARLGIVSPRYLAAKRKWALLLAFIISGVATPTTDMVTQSIMGGAMYFLYEVSIWLSYLVRSKKTPALATAEGSSIEIDSGTPSAAANGDPEGSDLGETYRDIVRRGENED